LLEVARYQANGHLDSTVGTHGQTEIKRVTGRLPSAVLAEDDGKLLIAAARRIVRLLPNGTAGRRAAFRRLQGRARRQQRHAILKR
jgi:hypothetical protein